MNSKYISNKFLNWLLNGQALSTVTGLRVGLLTVMPDEDGLNYAEPVGGGYQRADVDPSFFTVSTQMMVENSNTIFFPTSTAGWGSVIGTAIFELDGTLAWASEFQNPIEVLSDTRPAFPPGKLKFYIGTIPDGYWEDGQNIQIPDGYYEDGLKLLNEPDGYWEEGTRSQIPDGYYEGGVSLESEPDGYWEEGTRSQIPDGYYEGGELVDPPEPPGPPGTEANPIIIEEAGFEVLLTLEEVEVETVQYDIEVVS
jgi:hypothetical protein